MSIECGECERDLRAGHDRSCSRWFDCTCDPEPVLDCPTHGQMVRRRKNTYRTGEGNTISNVHLPENCEGPCPIHRPSNHHMKDWPTGWRSHQPGFREAAGFMVRVCEHGSGHVDPDEMYPPEVHACDGCCKPEAAVESYGPDPGHRWPY